MNKIISLACAAFLLVPLATLHAAELRSEVRGQSRFEDALATIATPLEAEPAHNDVRYWTPRAKGSVRLVGHIKKTSANTDAVFDVLVGGKPVWSRVLNSSETMWHAFDVAVYDLDTRSQVEFRMTAGSGRAGVDMAVDILPEPYLSRWSPALATGYPQWNEAAKVDLRAKGQQILQLIRDASKDRRGKLVIPPGDYLFHANWSQASTLSGLKNLEILAEGVTFWFEPPMVSALLFDNSYKSDFLKVLLMSKMQQGCSVISSSRCSAAGDAAAPGPKILLSKSSFKQVGLVEVEETFEQDGLIEVGTCRSWRLELSSGMQKQRIHHLLLLLALVFGLGATACPVADQKPGEVLQEPLLHIAHQEPFEQVGLVEVWKRWTALPKPTNF